MLHGRLCTSSHRDVIQRDYSQDDHYRPIIKETKICTSYSKLTIFSSQTCRHQPTTTTSSMSDPNMSHTKPSSTMTSTRPFASSVPPISTFTCHDCGEVIHFLHMGHSYPTSNALWRKRVRSKCSEPYYIDLEYPDGFALDPWTLPYQDPPDDVRGENGLGLSLWWSLNRKKKAHTRNGSGGLRAGTSICSKFELQALAQIKAFMRRFARVAIVISLRLPGKMIHYSPAPDASPTLIKRRRSPHTHSILPVTQHVQASTTNLQNQSPADDEDR